MFKISIAFYKKNHVCWESIMDFLREPYSIYLVCPRKHGSSSTVYCPTLTAPGNVQYTLGILFHQITIFIKVCVAFVFGLPTL